MRTLLVLLSFFILFQSQVFAEAPKITSSITRAEINELIASDGAAEDYFGWGVAISGDTAVIGAPGVDDGSKINAGFAYVYEKDLISGLFVQVARLAASDRQYADSSGRSVAISGDTILIGVAADDNGTIYNTGSVYVFEKPASGWEDITEIAKLTASDAEENDSLGSGSIAISGDMVVVGVSTDDDAGDASGSVYVFEKLASGWADSTEIAKLTASDAAAGDYFGCSVDISGDTIVVGARRDDDAGDNSGSAYLFEKPASGWANATETAKFIAANTSTLDQFGNSVAISGNTIVVGAYSDKNFDYNPDVWEFVFTGSAYVFEKNQDTGFIEQLAKLNASDYAEYDYFGAIVAIDGDTVLIGAHGDDDGGLSSGSAYLFEKPATGWADMTETVKFTASDAAAGDGLSNFNGIAISGDSVLIGAYKGDGAVTDSGSAYIYQNIITENFLENQKDILNLEASDADGDVISFAIEGGSDASIFEIDATTGLFSFKNAPDFESPSDLDSDNLYETIIKVSDNAGESNTYNAYVRVGNVEYEGGTPDVLSFAELEKLTASDAAAGDFYSYSVAVSGDTVVVGAINDDDTGDASGSAYVYERDPATGLSVQVAKLTASDGAADDYFGSSVAISGDTIVVGADGDDDGGTDSGSAYVYEKNPATGLFEQVVKLTASDAAADDRFGNSVAVSGDTVVIGADGDDDGGLSSGSSYLFEKPVTGWADVSTETIKLTAFDATGYDYFGKHVAISGDTVVIGADGDDDNGASSGSAYIYQRAPISGIFAQVAKLTASDAAADDRFGNSVAVSGDTVVIGAYGDSSNSGSAYLFEKSATGWGNATETAKLTASDAAVDDRFGQVAISGDTVVIGAFFDDDAGDNSGSAYLFEKPASGWVDATETVKLTASDAEAGDWFGISAAVSGDTVVIGANYDDDTGSAYIFKPKENGGSNPSIIPAIIMLLLD